MNPQGLGRCPQKPQDHSIVIPQSIIPPANHGVPQEGDAALKIPRKVPHW
jgi:hypothetical protein